MREQETITLKNGNYPIKAVDENGKETSVEEFSDFKRDEGKIFRLTEMSAMAREEWQLEVITLMRDSMDEETLKIAEEHSAVAAFMQMSTKDVKNILAYTRLCNKFLYCYEFYDSKRDMYIKLTPENINNYIMENESLGWLRNYAQRFHDRFFTNGSTANSQQ
jgi:hypothetical protein